jgi:hypothetical protein
MRHFETWNVSCWGRYKKGLRLPAQTRHISTGYESDTIFRGFCCLYYAVEFPKIWKTLLKQCHYLRDFFLLIDHARCSRFCLMLVGLGFRLSYYYLCPGRKYTKANLLITVSSGFQCSADSEMHWVCRFCYGTREISHICTYLSWWTQLCLFKYLASTNLEAVHYWSITFLLRGAYHASCKVL